MDLAQNFVLCPLELQEKIFQLLDQQCQLDIAAVQSYFYKKITSFTIRVPNDADVTLLHRCPNVDSIYFSDVCFSIDNYETILEKLIGLKPKLTKIIILENEGSALQSDSMNHASLISEIYCRLGGFTDGPVPFTARFENWVTSSTKFAAHLDGFEFDSDVLGIVGFEEKITNLTVWTLHNINLFEEVMMSLPNLSTVKIMDCCFTNIFGDFNSMALRLCEVPTIRCAIIISDVDSSNETIGRMASEFVPLNKNLKELIYRHYAIKVFHIKNDQMTIEMRYIINPLKLWRRFGVRTVYLEELCEPKGRFGGNQLWENMIEYAQNYNKKYPETPVILMAKTNYGFHTEYK